jgi:hypothetical protein
MGFTMTFSYMYITHFDQFHAPPRLYSFLSPLSPPLVPVLSPNSPSSISMSFCLFYFYILTFFFFGVLVIKHRASYLLGKGSTTWAMQLVLVCFKSRFHIWEKWWLHTHVHSSTVHNSQIKELASVPSNRWVDRENVVPYTQ